MVQQQFIIAELSQDSSVITAHITVGNQSMSRAQKSNEELKQQVSVEQQKRRGVQRKKDSGETHNIIKIEDNIDDGDDIDFGVP